MRIAYEHADSFVTYPQAPNLSAKAEPIRKRLTYPRVVGLSAAATHTRSCAAGPYWWQCGRPAWTTTCGVNLRSKGAQAATCPADPATPVDDAAIPVGDGTTPRRSHPSSLHLSATSGAYPSNTARFITQSRAPTDPLRRPPPDARRPSLRVRRCHDPRVGGQRAQPGNPQRIRNVGGATRPGHTERGTDKRDDVRRGPAQAS